MRGAEGEEVVVKGGGWKVLVMLCMRICRDTCSVGAFHMGVEHREQVP